MNTNKELNYRLYIHREENFHRTDLHREFSRYDAIRNGDIELVKKNIAEIRATFYQGKSVLSQNPIRSNIYHLVVGAGIIARQCIEAGMPHDESYTLSDIYIQKADVAKTPEEVIDLICEMHLDFAKRMHDIHTSGTISVHVRRAVNYIYDHLNEALTMEGIAQVLNLNPSYFSKLFSSEMHISVKKYIIKTKLATAKSMLENPDYRLSDIAFSLGFSSQSSFTSSFKNEYGITPGKYQKTHLDNRFSSKGHSM